VLSPKQKDRPKAVSLRSEGCWRSAHVKRGSVLLPAISHEAQTTEAEDHHGPGGGLGDGSDGTRCERAVCPHIKPLLRGTVIRNGAAGVKNAIRIVQFEIICCVGIEGTGCERRGDVRRIQKAVAGHKRAGSCIENRQERESLGRTGSDREPVEVSGDTLRWVGTV
jgi:hypothetical protein